MIQRAAPARTTPATAFTAAHSTSATSSLSHAPAFPVSARAATGFVLIDKDVHARAAI
jgi:hypothetical protein